MLLAEVVTGFMAAYGAYVALAGMAAMAIGAGVSIYSGYQAQSAANEAARMQESASQAAANAQQMAAQAQAQQLQDKADLARLQADTEDKKAAVAQQQGEIEARRRMIALSETIGATYSQYAGNNLLVDGGNDTLGQLLTANVREGAQDVGIVKSNAENAVWEHSMNKTASLMTAGSLEGQAGAALSIGSANAYATLLSGEAQAFATRQAGLTALYQGWGSGISALGSAAMMGYRAFGPAAGASAGAGSNVYAWNTTGGFSTAAMA